MSIQINQKLDDFTLPSVKQQEISEFSLYEFLRQQQSQNANFKGFVLFFYPKDQSKCCITEVQSFAALYADFLQNGVEIVGISRDSVKSHQNFETKQNLAVNAKGYIANFLQLSQQINCSGNIGYIPDNDGVLRVIPLFTKYNDKNNKNKQIYSHLTLSLLLCYDKIFKQHQNQNLTALSENLNTQNFWRIPYTKTMEDYTVIPANLFFDNSKITQFMPLDDFKNLLKNKYVLIGSSAVSLGDRTSTPLLALTPGILVHAQILSALLDSTYNDFNAKSNANSNINENFPRETKNFFQNLVNL